MRDRKRRGREGVVVRDIVIPSLDVENCLPRIPEPDVGLGVVLAVEPSLSLTQHLLEMRQQHYSRRSLDDVIAELREKVSSLRATLDEKDADIAHLQYLVIAAWSGELSDEQREEITQLSVRIKLGG